LLFFGYTHCPDVCPGTLAALKKAQPQWEAAAPDTQVVFFSVDPQRDTPEVLKGYVSYFDPKFVGVTAPREMLAGLARIFGIIYIRVAGSSGEPNDYLVDHSASIVLIDPQGRLAGVLSAPHTPEDIAKRYITIRTAFLCCG
jgi:protein SCO1/2